MALEDLWLGEDGLPEVKEHPRVIRAMLLMVAAKHQPTYVHLRHVSNLTGRLAQWMELPPARVKLAAYAGLLHDVGKVAIPDHILTKPGRLSDREAQIMMTHAAAGADVLHRCGGSSELCGAIRHHHEWFDGRGYPAGLHGEQIPTFGRMIGIADAFDTMTTPRPYRQAVSVSSALTEVERCAGIQFDSQLAGQFVSMIRDAGRRGETWVRGYSHRDEWHLDVIEPLALRLPH